MLPESQCECQPGFEGDYCQFNRTEFLISYAHLIGKFPGTLDKFSNSIFRARSYPTTAADYCMILQTQYIAP